MNELKSIYTITELPQAGEWIKNNKTDEFFYFTHDKSDKRNIQIAETIEEQAKILCDFLERNFDDIYSLQGNTIKEFYKNDWIKYE